MGLQETATHCLQKTDYLRRQLATLERFEIAHDGPVFKEFVVRDLAGDVEGLLSHAEKCGVLAGVNLEPYGARFQNQFLVAVTEKRIPAEMDALTNVLRECPANSVCT